MTNVLPLPIPRALCYFFEHETRAGRGWSLETRVRAL